MNQKRESHRESSHGRIIKERDLKKLISTFPEPVFCEIKQEEKEED